MAQGPCVNPSCASHGKPHPNCKCYSFAEGGCVSAHNPDCFFAQGGDVAPDFIPEGQEPVSGAPDFVSDHEAAPDFVAEGQEPQQNSPYNTPGQSIIGGAEALARGVSLGASDAAETALGVPAEDIKGRKEAHPVANNLVEGVGNLAPLSLAPETEAASAGATFIKGALQGGLLHAGDELSKSILGQGDPETAASAALAYGKNMLFGGGIGLAAHGLGLGASRLLKVAEDAKLDEKAQKFVMGIGMGQTGLRPEAQLDPVIKKGVDFYSKGIDAMTKAALEGVGAVAGVVHGGLGEAVGGGYTGKAIDYLLGRPISNAVKKYVAPALLRSLGAGGEGAAKAVDYGMNVAKGAKAMGEGVSSLFKAGGQKALDLDVSDKDMDKLDEHVQSGDYNNAQEPPQSFAEGGLAVPPVDHFANTFPEQATILQAARTRVPNYLNSIRPAPGPKLPFDKEMSTRVQEKSYKKALGLALQPLGILNEIKDGSITPEQLKHFNSMYPELHNQLSKQITQKISEHQVKGEKPSYKVRQGLSLFLGAPLDSSFTPQSIMAAQAVFVKQSQQQQAPAPEKNKKGTSTLTKASKQYETREQAAESRERS